MQAQGQMKRVGPGPKALLKIYWADGRFYKPGLYIWTGRRNRRILPWRKK